MNELGPEADLDRILAKRPPDQSSLIGLLQDIQEAHGYVSNQAMIALGRTLGIPTSKIHGVATFYNQFRFEAPGKFHIQVCRGTACHVKGSAQILSAIENELNIVSGQRTRDGVFSLEVVACIGACGLAPVIAVNGKFHASVDPDRVRRLLRSYRKEADQVPVPESAPSDSIADAGQKARLDPERERIESMRYLLERIGAGADQAEVPTERLLRLRRQKVTLPTVYVGGGTCGLGAGADRVLYAAREHAKLRGIQVEVVELGCLGLCADEPIVEIQLPSRPKLTFAKVQEQEFPALFDAVLSGAVPTERLLGQSPVEGQLKWPDVARLDQHPFFVHQTRHVLERCGIIDPGSIDEAIAFGAYQALGRILKDRTPAEACELVEKSGLRGRGGGGFSTGTKWKLALSTPADQRIFICNADEGDPGAFMDRAVIEGDPHRVLEGLAIGAYAIGASKAYIYIRAEYPLAITRLEQAIAQAKAYGLLGENLLGSGFSLEVVIKKGAGAFVCGEETALINSIEGRRGSPRPRPPYPTERGVFGVPTVINNVETLANVAGIVLHGPDWFRSLGTAASKGTKVFALSGKIQRTGLVEVAMGTSLRRIVCDIGGGAEPGRALKAVQIGGPSGGCVPTEHLDIEIDYESLRTVGAMMGSGGLVVMDDRTCMVDVAKFFMGFIQRESCGKCIPCREGTKRMLEVLQSISRNYRNERDHQALDRFQGVTKLESLAQVIRDTSLCGLGNSAPNPVVSTLRWFRKEYEEHVYDRKCSAGVCKELLSYSIDPEACRGCGVCVKRCPADAILGTRGYPYAISPDRCVGCGACLEACRLDAVRTA